MEIIKPAFWLVQHDAQNELESMTLMQIAPTAIHIIEQDVAFNVYKHMVLLA
jgi:hypothetical protein